MVTSESTSYILFVVYVSVSYLIFYNVNKTVHTVIDEEFHIPQGLAYCNFDFSSWDPKITTLPGLYIISTIFLGPLNLCSTYWLRFVNFLVGIINLFFLAVLCGGFDEHANERQKILGLFSGFNLALLPPLYFFTNLYYTDVVSIMFITLLLVFNKCNRHFAASICGLFSVMVRQTNIIWVAMLLGDYSLKQFHYHCVKARRKRIELPEITEEDVQMLGRHHFKSILNLRYLPKAIWRNIYAYSAVIVLFLIFLLVNGGIVVGDKAAHVAVIHFPQLFYFSLFCLVFAWPHFLYFIVPFIKYVWKHILFVTILITTMIIIVYLNTLVHPYLLADNRHYTFYIWNRLYQRIPLFRYIVTPIYLFGLYSIFLRIYSRIDVTFALMYFPCVTFVLILQQMIEIRYFLIPFVILRSKIRCFSYKPLFLELLTYILINFVTFTIFFTKDIYWNDFDYVQKLIW